VSISLFVLAKRLLGKLPKVGDVMWWASKQVDCQVVEVGPRGFLCIGGELVETKKNRRVPRWTVLVPYDNATWDDKLHAWIVGKGEVPQKLPGRQIVMPEPVQMKVRL